MRSNAIERCGVVHALSTVVRRDHSAVRGEMLAQAVVDPRACACGDADRIA
jgi:hypothetical protein